MLLLERGGQCSWNWAGAGANSCFLKLGECLCTPAVNAASWLGPCGRIAEYVSALPAVLLTAGNVCVTAMAAFRSSQGICRRDPFGNLIDFGRGPRGLSRARAPLGEFRFVFGRRGVERQQGDVDTAPRSSTCAVGTEERARPNTAFREDAFRKRAGMQRHSKACLLGRREMLGHALKWPASFPPRRPQDARDCAAGFASPRTSRVAQVTDSSPSGGRWGLRSHTWGT